MFNKFTERARKVLLLAKEQARRFNHDYIGTEHILLGLVREDECVAAKVLMNLGIGLSKVRSAVEFIIGRGEKPSSGETGLTPRAKKVIELAKEILNENIERSTITVGIPVTLGFHSRPSLLVAKIVQHYGGQVELCVGSDRFDASSVLDLQWAGGKIQKENITEVVFAGDARTLKDIEILARVNYGEDTMGKDLPLPKELNYLK